MPENILENSGKQVPKYWKSIEQYNQSDEYKESSHHEFDEGVKDEFDPEQDANSFSRRKFFALIGASAAFTVAGCSDFRDKGEIVPYNRKPEDIIVGKPNFYASTCTACELSCGILIKTREGRPIKADGNPDHPVNKGKICSIGESHILNLYDPSRLHDPKSGKTRQSVEWNSVDEQITNALKSSSGKEIAFILPKVVSPTFNKVLEEFKSAYPTTKFYVLENNIGTSKISAWKKSFGDASFPIVDYSKAKIILAIESDFLGNEENPVENKIQFSKTRDTDNIAKFSRLYSAEANMSLTGMNADVRLRIKPEQQTAFVLGLINGLITKYSSLSASLDSVSRRVVEQYPLKKVISELKLSGEAVNALVRDLAENSGKSVVVGGNSLSEDTHIAINLLNEILDAKSLYKKKSFVNEHFAASTLSDFEQLAKKLSSGNVSVLVNFDVNPVYILPEDIGFAAALKNFGGLSVTLTEFENETSSLSSFALPVHHTYEAWGDASYQSSVISTQQPVINPLYNTRQKEGVVLSWISGKANVYTEELYHKYLMENWKAKIYPALNAEGTFDRFWLSVLHDGVVETKSSEFKVPAMNQSAVSQIQNALSKSSSLSLLVLPSQVLGNGKYAQNGWLQELPHPVSKVTWDNYAAISEKTSKQLNLKTNDLVEIEVKGKSIKIPVLMQPGLADDILVIESGYGRTDVSIVALNVGVNANKLISKNYSVSPFYFNNVNLKKLNEVYKLASSQDHHNYDESLIQDLHKKREIIQEGTVEEYSKDKDFLKKEHKALGENIYTEFKYGEVKWGMSIDLNKCTGCSNCVVSCDVENNIPVVGKDQVMMSREMHWMRIDRYYSGTPESPQVSTQPMLCQHCDQAPCENVCPVVATTHSPDGLNQMIYNRCVGTRYCSNNCPYKVRRFNFFNFRDHFASGHYLKLPVTLAANPEVTVRSRGVMEKCTFCVHRIAEGRADAVREGRVFDGAGITTACQDVCPSNAIEFGNVNLKDSKIAKKRNSELGYSVLEELNIKPNVTYLAKLRNIESEKA